MIAVSRSPEETRTTWQAAFVALLPEIQQRLTRAFRHLDAEAREDAVEEGVVHCLLSFARLYARGCVAAASASSLAWFAAKQVKRGRLAVGRLNNREPLSRYAQLSRGFRVEWLSRCSNMDAQWIDRIVEDRRSSVADQVAVRLDARAWLATLSGRTRQVARELACGYSTGDVARRHGVTPGRISQLRRELYQAWQLFQGEASAALK
jgi:hypothetical protein